MKWTLGLGTMSSKYVFLSQVQLSSIFNNDKKAMFCWQCLHSCKWLRCYQTRSEAVHGIQSRNGHSCSSHQFKHEMNIYCVFSNLSLNDLFTPLIQHSSAWYILSRHFVFFNWHERWKWYGHINARVAFIGTNDLFYVAYIAGLPSRPTVEMLSWFIECSGSWEHDSFSAIKLECLCQQNKGILLYAFCSEKSTKNVHWW